MGRRASVAQVVSRWRLGVDVWEGSLRRDFGVCLERERKKEVESATMTGSCGRLLSTLRLACEPAKCSVAQVVSWWRLDVDVWEGSLRRPTTTFPTSQLQQPDCGIHVETTTATLLLAGSGCKLRRLAEDITDDKGEL